MSDWFAADVIANGIKIHYYRTGGDKPPLVLSHGSRDNGLCWTRITQVLEKDYDVIMPDARGHGFSDAPETGYTARDRADDLAGLIQALGLEKPGVMGHSMGARSTAALVVGYPDLASCAILEDPGWRGRLSGLSPEEPRARAEERRASMLELRAKTREEVMAFGREQNPTWAEVEFGPWADSKLQVSPKHLMSVEAPRAHWSEIVPKITCPTLLVTADPELGSAVTAEVAEAAASMNPHIQVVHISGAGHNIRREQFEQFVQAVTGFLADTMDLIT
jgi:N-formylmaleamate deformylase